MKEFGSIFGGSRVSLQTDGEIVLELRGETNEAIDKALKAIERWLAATGIRSAKVWVGDHSYMLERPGRVKPKLRATLLSWPQSNLGQDGRPELEGSQLDTSSNGAPFIRRVNNSIYHVLIKLGMEDGEFWCECDDPSCEKRVTLTLREYAALRDRASNPLLSRSHALPHVAPSTDSAHV